MTELYGQVGSRGKHGVRKGALGKSRKASAGNTSPLACRYRRGFAFYVADPIRSIQLPSSALEDNDCTPIPEPL